MIDRALVLLTNWKWRTGKVTAGAMGIRGQSSASGTLLKRWIVRIEHLRTESTDVFPGSSIKWRICPRKLATGALYS